MTSSLLEGAKALLLKNDTGVFIKPGSHQYPHQWNWDVAFNALGLSYFDLERANLEVRSLLSGQWASGKVPHILYHHGASDYFPTPNFWQTKGLQGTPAFVTSGISQLPILATGIYKMLQSTLTQPDTLAFIKEVYPKLLAWHKWWYSARDPQQTGLVAIIHPWESTDNSPRWDEGLDALKPERLPEFERKDKKHVNADERPVEDHYNKYMYLIDTYRKLEWDDNTIFKQAPFLIQCTLVNVLLHQSNQDLLLMAELLDEDRSEIKEWLERGERAFEGLWHEEDGHYYDRNLKTNTLTQEDTFTSLSTLFAGIPSQERAKRLIETHLLNPQRYAPSDSSTVFLPCVSKANTKYDPLRYWRGPVWMSANWIIEQGLKRYGYTDLAQQIKAQSLDLIEQSGFYEYFDPRNGAAKGADGFSWTAALAIDWLLSDAKG